MRSHGGETIRNGVLTSGAGLALFGMFAPWVRSGSSTRSSFELLDLAQRLGFTPGGAFEWGVRPWPFVPALLVVAVIAGWSARRVAATVSGSVASVYVIAVAVAVFRAPNAGLVSIEWGTWVTLAGGIVLLGASCWFAASRSA